jgi:hypothetical protein
MQNLKTSNIQLPDKKALKILFDYNVLVPTDTSVEDFEYAKKAGLMFNPIVQTHEEAVGQLFEEYKICSKQAITDLFLASLSSNRLEWRAGFPVYAIMQTLPRHQFEPASSELLNQCAFCCGSSKRKVDLSFMNTVCFIAGGVVSCDVYEYAFVLKQHNLLPSVKPKQEDFEIFSSLLDLCANVDAEDTPTKLLKKLKIQGFKSTEEQRRFLINTMGYCSILETENQKGFLTKYTNLGVAPRKSHYSDWHYPVDWWKGKDGINKEAVKFWFGEYPEFKKYFE